MLNNYLRTEKGLLIASDIMPNIGTVSISVLVKTGSRYENAEMNGISHYLEHMAFKGTEKRSAKQIAEEFDMIGGYLNAYTSREVTVYQAKILKEDLDLAVDILSDIIQHSTFTNEELERERTVILQEKAQTEDDPESKVFEYFQEVAFPNQPLGRNILGSEEFIKNVTRENIINYINSRYGYNNVIIVAAGTLNHDYFSDLIVEKFNDLPSQSAISYDAANYSGGEIRIEKDLEQVHLVLGFPGVSYLDKDYYTQQVLALILGGSMSSRLFQEVREKRGLAYNISAFGSSYSDCGIFGIYSATNSKDVDELLKVAAEQLYDLTQQIHEDELQRAKAQVRAGLLMNQEKSAARADNMANNYAIFGRYITIEEIIQNINDIDTRAVQNMMSSILQNQMPPTFAAIGKLKQIKSYNDIVQRFKL